MCCKPDFGARRPDLISESPELCKNSSAGWKAYPPSLSQQTYIMWKQGAGGSCPKERSSQRVKRTGKVTAGKVVPAFVPSLEKLGPGAPTSHDTPPSRPLELSAQAYTHKTVPEEGFVRTQQ